MSFLFGRARTRTNTIDLSKQAREHVLKLEVPGKVGVHRLPLYPLSLFQCLLQG